MQHLSISAVIAALVLGLPLGASATDLAVYDSTDLTQPIGIIQSFVTSGSAASNYNYSSSSGHPAGVNLANTHSNVWVHENSQTGEFAFGFIFAKDAGGAPTNSASFAFRIVDSTSNVAVAISDDPGEAVESSPGSFQGTFRYGNNTDGIMVAGIAGNNWTIIIDAVDFGSVTNWFAAGGASGYGDDISLTLGREYRITPVGNTVSSVPVDPRDSDSDGVLDSVDMFPCDGSASGEAYAPGKNVHTAVLFEDHWPDAGDLDFNDVVLTYNYAFQVDALGQPGLIRANIDVLAIGGDFHNGLGLSLPVPASEVEYVQMRVDGGNPVALSPRAADANLTLTIANDLRTLFGGQVEVINADPARPVLGGHSIEVQIKLRQPTALAISEAPYDLFIFRTYDPSHEIHRSAYAGTAGMNTALFGTGDDASGAGQYFKDTTGLPFALEIPPSPPYPAEGMPIQRLYPDIVGFAASGGTQNLDFYQSTVDLTAAYDVVSRPSPTLPRALASDTSCLPVMGSTSEMAGLSCRSILSLGASTGDGDYWIDPDEAGGEPAFLVSCDMTSSAGGWIELQLDHSDGVIVGEYDRSNPWHKCADDSARYFKWLSSEAQISPDFSPNDYRNQVFALNYLNPATGQRFTAAQLTLLRGLVSELNPLTRMVALTSDDDSGNYETTGSGGHEVYVRGPGQAWLLLTPGEDGQCGGSSGSWPYSNTQSGYRLWHTSPAYCAVDGDLSVNASAVTGLPQTAIIPADVRLNIQTGGGAAFGWEERTFLVR